MTTDVVQKLWGLCHTLRHDGVDYGEYIEQITYLLFLKMADEKGIDLSAIGVSAAKGKSANIDCSWSTLGRHSGTALVSRYIEVLRALGQAQGILGDIYFGAQCRFNHPVNLQKIVHLIDETPWTRLGVDVKAQAYEGLLEKAASEGKKGAGQFFTPRVLIQSIVRCVRPDPRESPDFTICDPAVGTGGFLIAAYEWLADKTRGTFEREVAQRIKTRTYFGEELVARPRRLALMNLYLHGIEPQIRLGDAIYDPPSPSRFDCILTNPPFGTRGASQIPERDDFTIASSNKQLNFLQHILTILKSKGRAAVVLPDNVLFADQAGEVLQRVTEHCDLHTVLRLPRGTFTPYSQGVKANVLFFTKGPKTENVWIYDARTNVEPITKKDRPLTSLHFAEFEKCFGQDPHGKANRTSIDSPSNRWRRFHRSEVADKQFKLDGFKWLKEEFLEDAADLPTPEELATGAIGELEQAVSALNRVLTLLEGSGNSSARARS